MNREKYNASGCKDLTAYEAIRNVEESEKRRNKLLKEIFKACEKAGFHLENRLVLKDKKTGHVWR